MGNRTSRGRNAEVSGDGIEEEARQSGGGGELRLMCALPPKSQVRRVC